MTRDTTNAMEARDQNSTVVETVVEHVPLVVLVGSFISFYAVTSHTLGI